MRSRRMIEKELTAASEVVAVLQAELVAGKQRTRVPCSNCGRRSVVSSLIYRQTHWYDENTGSPNGGHWMPGEGRFDCPKCGHENRPCNNPFDFVALKRYFKEVVSEYGRTGF